MTAVPDWVKASFVLGGGLAVFIGIYQMFGALRLSRPKTRELSFGAVLVVVGTATLCEWVYATRGDLQWWRAVPAAGPIGSWLLITGTHRFSRATLVIGYVLAVALTLFDLFSDLPLAPVPSVDAAGRITIPVTAGFIGMFVVVFGLIWSVDGWRRAVAEGETDLKVLAYAAIPLGVLLALASAEYAGAIPLPPLEGFIAGCAALGVSVWRLEREATLIKRADAKPDVELGGYRLLERIGKGGMAEVWVGARTGPGGFEKKVAIKRVLDERAEDPEMRSMFLDEARLAAKLHHENIVSIHELGEDRGALFLVMELCDGIALSKLRKAHRTLPIDLVVAVGAQMLSGLAYAHSLAGDDGKSLGLVHRDISPQNVMIDARGAVHILDFGIARAAGKSTHTATGVVKGKLAYMAPEQLDGKEDARADVFATGVVLCELACGKGHVEGLSDLAMVATLLRRDFAPPAELASSPAPIRDVVTRALAADPAARFASAAEMRAALLAAAPGFDLERAKEELGRVVAALQPALKDAAVAEADRTEKVTSAWSSLPTKPDAVRRGRG
jgi:serine/threonine protein kinase